MEQVAEYWVSQWLQLGYIEINMTFPADFLGSSINVDTLALVVPDVQQSHPMILVGTNTLDVAYSKHCDTHSEQSFLPTGSGYIAVYKILQCRHVQNLNDQYAPVILKSDQPHTITARPLSLRDAWSQGYSKVRKQLFWNTPPPVLCLVDSY